MRKKVVYTLCSILVILTLILITVFASAHSPVLWEDDFNNELFRFNPSTHSIYDTTWSASQIVHGTFEDFDAERHPGTAIVIGEVAGPSLNRIIWPRNDLRDLRRGGGWNHVITPVLVHYIIFVGEEIEELMHIQVGEIVDVMEGYFYVTAETQEYANFAPLGQIRTILCARPMESGNRYLIYLHHGGNWSDSIYRYNGELVLSAIDSSLVYRLGSIGPIAALSNNPNPNNIPGWHEAALATHGHLHQILPEVPPDPIITPRTEDELNIIIQGTPIATAIYDGDGNRLIQDGLNLYRQRPGGSLERVGQRVSISHALRRYQYILEPGEWIFRDLDFSATALPSSFQVLAFEDNERVALAYYADSPSSSQMELHIMPSGRTVLTDKDTGTVIPPTEEYFDDEPITSPGSVSHVEFVEAHMDIFSRMFGVDITVTGIGFKDNNVLELRAASTFGGFTVIVDPDGRPMNCFACCSGHLIDLFIEIASDCQGGTIIPFNVQSDTMATLSFDSQGNGGYSYLWLSVYLNGEPTGFTSYVHIPFTVR